MGLYGKKESDNKAGIRYIRKKRNDEISNKFLLGADWTDKDLYNLSIQDICVLINNGKWILEKKAVLNVDEKMRMLIDKLYKILVEKTKSSEILYTIIDQTTDYPFIDKNNCIWLFSVKDFAYEAESFYKQRHRNFQVKEIINADLNDFFADIFYYAGAAGLYIDNGLSSCLIKNEDLLKPPDWTGIQKIRVPIMNPDLMLAHLKMSQETGWKINYDGKEKVLDNLELELCRQSVKSEFLVPVNGMPNQGEEVSAFSLEKDAKISIPILHGKDGSTAIPAFTDWKQFRLCYNDKEFGGWIMSFNDLAEFVMAENRYDGFVINIGKCPLVTTSKNIERIRYLLDFENKDGI